MVQIILKILGMMCATLVAYKLATKEEGILKGTHPYTALFLKLGALAIIFLS
ncbi:MAG: hypothetical protein HFJ33_00040 [Clostridia bacterium]|nr:hypothetical protein [Clostridia bacterium]